MIYYLRDREGVIWLLTLYAKNEATVIPVTELRQIAREIDHGQDPE